MANSTQEPILPKFNIGEQVQIEGDKEVRNVVSFQYDSVSKSFVYTLTSTEVDVAAKKLIEGVVHCPEDNIISVEPKKE